MIMNIVNSKKLDLLRVIGQFKLTDIESTVSDPFVLLNGGNTIHSSDKANKIYDIIEVYNTDESLYGRYWLSAVSLEDPDGAIVWNKL